MAFDSKTNTALQHVEVRAVRHWTPQLFSITTSRDPGFRYDNGQFVMLGLLADGKPLLRAYSIASPNWADELEFYSIKVPNGPLTSRLKDVSPGDTLLLSRKPTGTLLISDLKPGRNLYLLATGTGLAPFLAIVRDPETYERFERVVVVHGVRKVADLAYRDELTALWTQTPYIGELLARQLSYLPVVSREPFERQGRITQLLDDGRLWRDLSLPPLDPAHDRAMLCGSAAMLSDLAAALDQRGFAASPRIGSPGDYVIERAFVER